MENKEYEYQVIMSFARGFLKQGLITEDQYRTFNKIMLEKHAIKIGDLFSDISLL